MVDWARLAVGPIHSLLGTPATYTPAGGAPVGVSVVDRQPDQIINGLNATQHRQVGRLLEIRRSDLSADPASGDAVTIGSGSYKVRSAKPADPDGLVFELDCVPDR